MSSKLNVLNLTEARFECVFPRCGGICCQQGEPAVEPDEVARITENLDRVLPYLRPEARAEIEASGFLSEKEKEGLPTAKVVDGWCIFSNDGCSLHKLGAEEGSWTQYKPWRCVAFPLSQREHDQQWFVRQWGLEEEAWTELFCLDPAASPKSAAETLAGELEFVARRTPKT